MSATPRNIEPELRALRAVLGVSPTVFAEMLGSADAELSDFAREDRRLTPAQTEGLLRAIEGVPREWQHAFPALVALVAIPSHGIEILSQESYTIRVSLLRAPDARQRPAATADPATDPSPSARPLTGRALRALRTERRLSTADLARLLDEDTSRLESVEAHVAPVPRHWAARLNAALGTHFTFPVHPTPLRHGEE